MRAPLGICLILIADCSRSTPSEEFSLRIAESGNADFRLSDT